MCSGVRARICRDSLTTRAWAPIDGAIERGTLHTTQGRNTRLRRTRRELLLERHTATADARQPRCEGIDRSLEVRDRDDLQVAPCGRDFERSEALARVCQPGRAQRDPARACSPHAAEA